MITNLVLVISYLVIHQPWLKSYIHFFIDLWKISLKDRIGANFIFMNRSSRFSWIIVFKKLNFTINIIGKIFTIPNFHFMLSCSCFNFGQRAQKWLFWFNWPKNLKEHDEKYLEIWHISLISSIKNLITLFQPERWINPSLKFIVAYTFLNTRYSDEHACYLTLFLDNFQIKNTLRFVVSINWAKLILTKNCLLNFFFFSSEHYSLIRVFDDTLFYSIIRYKKQKNRERNF